MCHQKSEYHVMYISKVYKLRAFCVYKNLFLSQTRDKFAILVACSLLQNFHRELAEEDEAYNTMKSTDRETFSIQLDMLQ